MLRTPHCLPSSLSLLRSCPKPLFSQNLHFRRYNLTAPAAQTTIEAPIPTPPDLNNHHHHPWPEWISFVDHLKAQGYFSRASSSSSNASELLYREMNLLKDPCLSFARDRYDIFKSLPKGDIQIIVEGGCPKLLRKVVNSAKRLRLYVGLDEKDVCSVCSLRGSCDRAYVMLKESEGDAQTVDLMRVLLFYALDPLVVSEAVKPPGIELAESSAKRLLNMFVDLSEATPCLAHLEPPTTSSSQKEQLIKSMDSVHPQPTKLPQKNLRCKTVNFVGGSQCKCYNEDSATKVGPADIELKEGDWICSKCKFMNFSRNVQCLKCKTEGPKQRNALDVKMKKGDWDCPQCGCINFASRRDCFRCKESRPPRILEPGEWECPKCDFLNFRRNVKCLKCHTERPKEAVVQYEERFWRRPQ